MLSGVIRTTTFGNSNIAYVARLATSTEEVRAAQMLRFLVFNLEFNEGLASSYDTCLDADPFDAVCDHLIVQDLNTNEVVGTYRLQTGTNAAEHLGYYSDQEFDLAPFESQRAEVIELGRACVARAHRNRFVLQLLWKAIASYAKGHHARYLLGCSSINSQNPREGAALYAALARSHLAPPELRTVPRPDVACPLGETALEAVRPPKLILAYLALGTWICGPPVIDREFKTIDFLTCLDLKAISPQAAAKYLS